MPVLVALVALLAAKPLLKLLMLAILAGGLFIAARGSGLGSVGGVLIVGFTLAFLLLPRRRG